MHVAVLTRQNDPLSLRLYERNMTRELSALGVEVIGIQEKDPVPNNCDMLWDPGMCMRRIPAVLTTNVVPVVGTMHGVKAFTLPLDELVGSPGERFALERLKEEVNEDWKWFRTHAHAITAVSRYAAREIIRAFSLPVSIVHLVPNGVDHKIFCTKGNRFNTSRPYFLHISRLDPVKNVARILASYSLLSKAERPNLVIVVTPEPDQKALLSQFEGKVAIDGVQWMREELSQEELACLYRGAEALLLPSLRETFGLPILEAMASGCPVITSNDTGCAETAGDSAILVDPRSVEEINTAMRRIMNEPELKNILREKGVLRSKHFSWRKSAIGLVNVFDSVNKWYGNCSR